MGLIKTNLFLVVFLLSGCASRPNLSSDDISKFDTVSINEETAIPPRPSFFGTGDEISVILGGLPGAYINAAIHSEPEEIKDYLSREKIDIGQIVRAEFLRQLESHPHFVSKIDSKSSTSFYVDIIDYGLQKRASGFFSKVYVPILTVKARLIDANGSVIWEDKGSSMPTGIYEDETSYNADYENYFKSPDNFRDAFTMSARRLINKFMKNL